MLTALFFIPLIGALSLLFVNKNESLIKRITLGTTILNFFISLIIWGKFDNNTHEYQFVQEWAEISFCHFNVGIDGISLFFVLLTTFLFPIIILTSWDHKNNIKHLFLNFLILESLLIATFIVLDLLLFYIFFESILIPLFIIIINFGDLLTKEKAGFLLFLYTLFGSLFMLLSIITILILTGTTDFQILSTINFGTDVQKLLFVGFLIAFIVKTPLIPSHIWLGFAHVAAPIGGSVLLAGVILKLATYLALRVMIPFLPDATLYFTPLIYTLAVISIIYASLTCLRLIDVKAIIAYSSIAHMGVVVLGLFSNNLQGIEGAVILGLSHGVISPLLFIIVGDILYSRSHTRIIKYYRGIASSLPVLSLIFFFATLANIGTPFSGNFIGEFMSFAGAFQQNPVMTILGATGMFLSAGYSIWLFNRVAFGSASRYMSTMPDITRREFFVLLPLIIVSFILGVYPNVVLDSLHLGISSLLIGVNTPPEAVLTFIPAIILLNEDKKENNNFLPKIDYIYVYNNILSSKSQISKELNNKTGIYYFYNRITSGGYVGSSQNLLRRIKEHLLEDSSQSSILLQRAIAKYKIDNFTLYILAIIDLTQEYSKSEIKDLLLAKEQLYLDHKDLDSSYNILKIAGSPLGSKQSEETKLLRSEIMAGENNPMFGKIGELNPFFNKKHTLESKLKMSSIKLGKELSLETRAKLREIGLKNSDKSRENLLKAKELHFEKFKMQQDIFKEKMKALSKKVYVYDLNNKLLYEFESQKAVAINLNIARSVLQGYLKSGKAYKDLYIFKYSSPTTVNE